MDYDLIFDEIGHFGRWQQLNFSLGCLCIIGSSFICFMFTFIGFIPKFRCYIPQCDGSLIETQYDTNFTKFAIPPNQDTDGADGPHQCSQYIFENISNNFGHLHSLVIDFDTCTEENFNRNLTTICHQHVYDDSQYKYPLTNELDLSPCESSSNYWNLEVSIIVIQCTFFIKLTPNLYNQTYCLLFI